jgi:hypothetical protein
VLLWIVELSGVPNDVIVTGGVLPPADRRNKLVGRGSDRSIDGDGDAL